MGMVVKFRGGHARASAGSGAGRSAKSSKVTPSTPCMAASRTMDNQRAGGMPRVRHPLTVLSSKPSDEATLPVPPSSSSIDPAVRMSPLIVRKLRTCQEFAGRKATFPAAYGPIRVMIDPPEVIGPRLKALRLALEFKTQNRFAEVIGVEKNTYNPWENGKRPLTFEAACAIRQKFGVPLDWLFYGADPEKLPARIYQRIVDAA